ncbi:DUF1007 family protein [Desulfohalovibrio reitneri]|uniref:DUF1007 family protein n=1 Tax=Desulfohalovibrio reitneri TaxID=1307759 RepID=UPI00068BC538|nr:DUF1007 family protein [Desulfohalovibrio reitneri]
MRRFILPLGLVLPLALAALAAAPSPARAHPHAFVECVLTVVFDENGLAGFRQHWTLDEMLSVQVMQMVDTNNDFELSEAEAASVEEKSFSHIANNSYFTHVLIDGKPFKAEWATDFTAGMDGNKMVYEFFVPCHVAAADTEKEVKVAVFDASFYTFVTLVSPQGGGGTDPTKDPQFGTGAGPSPDDYQRFKANVDVDSFQGEVPLKGPSEQFDMEAWVDMLPSLAYFHDQITPDGYVVRFKKK